MALANLKLVRRPKTCRFSITSHVAVRFGKSPSAGDFCGAGEKGGAIAATIRGPLPLNLWGWGRFSVDRPLPQVVGNGRAWHRVPCGCALKRVDNVLASRLSARTDLLHFSPVPSCRVLQLSSLRPQSLSDHVSFTPLRQTTDDKTAAFTMAVVSGIGDLLQQSHECLGSAYMSHAYLDQRHEVRSISGLCNGYFIFASNRRDKA